jgi:hypothetical protein
VFVEAQRHIVIDVATDQAALVNGTLLARTASTDTANPPSKSKISSAAPSDYNWADNQFDRQPDPLLPSKMLQDFRKALSRNVGHASTLGFLNLADDAARQSAQVSAPLQSAASEEPSEGEVAQVQNSDEANSTLQQFASNVVIRSASTLEQAMPQSMSNVSKGIGTCEKLEGFEVLDWTNGSTFQDENTNLTNSIFDQSGTVAPFAVVNLAKNYIYYGFGAEGR